MYFDAGQALMVPEDSDIEGVESLTSEHTVLAVKGLHQPNELKKGQMRIF